MFVCCFYYFSQRGIKTKDRGEEESLQKMFIRKKAITLIPFWPPVVLVTIQQLDVDKLQVRIAKAALSWLFMQSQDCRPHVHAQTIQLSART